MSIIHRRVDSVCLLDGSLSQSVIKDVNCTTLLQTSCERDAAKDGWGNDDFCVVGSIYVRKNASIMVYLMHLANSAA